MDAEAAVPTPVDHIAGELLDSVQGLPPVANERAQVLPLQHHLVGILLPGDQWGGLHPHVGEQAGLEAHNGLGNLIVLLRLLRGGDGAGVLILGRALGDGAGRGGLGLRLVLPLVGQPHPGRDGADAQKTGLAPLQDLHGHVVPGQPQLGQPLGDGLVLSLAGDFQILFHGKTLLSSLDRAYPSCPSCSGPSNPSGSAG